MVAQAIVSEIGIDMSCFPTAGHLLSWAGLCPKSDETPASRRGPKKAIIAVAASILTAAARAVSL
jgi:transposase